MTVAQEATELINRMPLQSQRVVLDMLKLMLNRDSGDMPSGHSGILAVFPDDHAWSFFQTPLSRLAEQCGLRSIFPGRVRK